MRIFPDDKQPDAGSAAGQAFNVEGPATKDLLEDTEQLESGKIAMRSTGDKRRSMKGLHKSKISL